MPRLISPILLCGGSGDRLWPLSRKSYPKQFVPLLGAETLFQAAAKRVAGADQSGQGGLNFAAPLVLSASDFRFIVTEQLLEVGIDPGAILLEPEGRNTAPAILAAALYLAGTDPDAVLLIMPSDHVIPDHAAFHEAIARGLPALDAGQMVTFGITPQAPETAYGYLELATPSDAGGPAVALEGFVEKPDRAQASAMLATGRYLWNAGIFLCRAGDLVAAFDRHAPDLLSPVRSALDGAVADLGFLRLDPDAWAAARSVSIDYAVMEKADNLSVVPFSSDWSDLGGWDALWRAGPQDGDGVTMTGSATAIDCQDSLLRAEGDGVALVGIGLKNIMAIAMSDAVLVADLDRAQDVKGAVAALKAKGASQATDFPKEHRPWGWFERLVAGPRFQVKRICVHAGHALSLQSHMHRSEHWIVVSGTAKVTVDGDVRLVSENQSVNIPLGAVHRLENPGKLPMMLIEVQTGAYMGEDDITRYADRYSRGDAAS